MKRRHRGIMLAAMAGTLFVTTGYTNQSSTSHEGSVKCVGANACKGNSACQTANNGCKGQNNCKAKGYIMTKSEKECIRKGGRVAEN